MNLYEDIDDMGCNVVPVIKRCRQCFKAAAWRCDRPSCQFPRQPATEIKSSQPRTKGIADAIAAYIEQNLDWFDTPRTTREICIALRATKQAPLTETSHRMGNKALRQACERGLLKKLGTTDRDARYGRADHD